MWNFDKSVANRFQHEAETNIPDYRRVVDLCIRVIHKKFKFDSKIVDVGSALGYTLDKLVLEGYSNVSGIESSQNMIDNSLHKEKVIQSDIFVGLDYDVVLINWTLHFIKNKWSYVQSVYNALNSGGVLILTDKTNQSETVKNLYYDFKRSNGVSDEYIYSKEESLKGYMDTKNFYEYVNNLNSIGFTVEILNASYGFVTFYCEKIC
jgi:trans-aconitate methyltransferase